MLILKIYIAAAISSSYCNIIVSYLQLGNLLKFTFQVCWFENNSFKRIICFKISKNVGKNVYPKTHKIDNKLKILTSINLFKKLKTNTKLFCQVNINNIYRVSPFYSIY